MQQPPYLHDKRRHFELRSIVCLVSSPTIISLDSTMLGDSPTTDQEPEPDEDLDDPYVHLVSTEEFVETAEKGSQEHEE
ncbi:hypothetical protein GCM10028774_27190 [Spirosoma jeollabukense]